MSLTADTEPHRDVLLAAVSRLAGWDAVELERIGGGRNSRVYRAADAASNQAALKVYFRDATDSRDRLATEFNSLTYLWQSGFRDIPHPVAADPESDLAVYEFVKGEKIGFSRPGTQDLDDAIEFLGRLRTLSRLPESRNLGAASEACFSARHVVENIQRRLDRFSGCREEEAARELRAFLSDEFVPGWERVIRWSQSHLERGGTSFEQELDPTQRTLSPSDFGFHNALKRADGRMIFLDFEYFGWDDPAKMIVDFLLHPAMGLGPDLKSRFTRGVLGHFRDVPGLLRRVEALYPLFGLKWCLILLNEFLPEPLLRRQFAGTQGLDRSDLQRQQLDKAKQMLMRIGQEYERFPYRD